MNVIYTSNWNFKIENEECDKKRKMKTKGKNVWFHISFSTINKKISIKDPCLWKKLKSASMNVRLFVSYKSRNNLDSNGNSNKTLCM